MEEKDALILNWTNKYNGLAEEKEALNNEWNLKWTNFNNEWESKYKALEAEVAEKAGEGDTIVLNWTNKYNALAEEKEALNNEWNLKWTNFNNEWEAKYKAIQENPPGMEEKDALILNWTNKYNGLAEEKEALNNEWNLKWTNFNNEWEAKYKALQEEVSSKANEGDTIILNWTNKYNALAEEKEALNNEWNLKWTNFNNEWEAKYKAIQENPPGMEEKDAIIVNWTNKYNALAEEKKAAEGDWKGKYKALEGDWKAKAKDIEGDWKGKYKALESDWKGKYSVLNNEWKGKAKELEAETKGLSSTVAKLEKELAAKPKEVKVEVIKEVPVEVVKEVIKEVEIEVIKEVPVEIIREVEVVKQLDFNSLRDMMMKMQTTETSRSVVGETRTAGASKIVGRREIGVKEDLTKIEGVGPKIAELLNNAGIYSFADLSKASSKKLKGILEAAGSRYQMHDPSTWAKQAKLAAGGKWEELEKWQDELNGGKGGSKSKVKSKAKPKAKSTKKVAKATKDNLTKIEGIGPKIAGLLNDAGINTFAELGKASVKTLKGILEAAGPRYKMHNPGSWPKQSKLAAAGKWDALDKLQDELDGGR